MIEIVQKQNLLYVFGKFIKNSDTKLLYTFDDLELNQKVRNNIRPFLCLGEKFECYRIKLLDYLPDILYRDYIPKPISGITITQMIEEIVEISRIFGINKKFTISKLPEISYICDVWNILSEIYSAEELNLIKGFQRLDSLDRNLVERIYKTSGKIKRLEIVRSEDWSTIYDLLPSDIQENLLLFGSDMTSIGKEVIIPEFRNQKELGPELPDLAQEIYKEFNLGEIILEGAEGIKERLSRVYQRCNIQKKPKMKDLEEFFIIVPCWLKGRRGFRIDFRR